MNLKLKLFASVGLIMLASGNFSCSSRDKVNFSFLNGPKEYIKIQKGSKEVEMPVGEMVTRELKVDGQFNAILSDNFIDVVYIQSSDPSQFKIEGKIPANIYPYVDLSVRDGKLKIGLKPDVITVSLNSKNNPVIYITAGELTSVELTGSGDFEANGMLALNSGDFSITSTGSGDFESDNITVSDGMISAVITGSGDIEFGGISAGALSLSVTGSGDIDCSNVSINDCNVNSTGSGDVEISGSAKNANLSSYGSGDIDAAKFKVENGRVTASGSGDIVCNILNIVKHESGSGSISNRQ